MVDSLIYSNYSTMRLERYFDSRFLYLNQSSIQVDICTIKLAVLIFGWVAETISEFQGKAVTKLRSAVFTQHHWFYLILMFVL